MKKVTFGPYKFPTEEWRLREESWDPKLLSTWEAQWTLGNGLLGSRAIYEELPEGSSPGTFLSGFFDRTSSQVAELVNLPNPFQLWFSLKGEKLSLSKMEFLSHHRELILKHGLLHRHTLFQDTRGNRYQYQSLRFLSMDDRHLGVLQVRLTPLDGEADFTVETALDTSVWNAGTVTEGKKKHWRVREISHQDSMEFVRISGLDEGHNVAFGTQVLLTQGKKTTRASDTHFRLTIKKRKTLILTKIVGFQEWGPDKVNNLSRQVRTRLKKAVTRGVSRLLKDHVRAWEKLWSIADVIIKREPEIQKALRFSLYHLLANGPAPGRRSSVGAKGLTGEGYRGHIFWDSDIFLFPFYLHVQPESAEEMLLYRYDRLEAARRIARQKAYRGAMFPWESAATGEEATPSWAKGLDKMIIPIHTHLEEHHITADVAYAVFRYYQSTGNLDFMLTCGFEILFETARFWASRVAYHVKKDQYEIKKVIGPDEFHESVNNNAFTNRLAQWNLLTAHHLALQMRSKHPRDYTILSRRIHLGWEEIQNWKEIGKKILMTTRKDGVIEQFEGYFKKKKVTLTSFDEYGLPKEPEDFHWSTVGKTQMVKQADVLLLFQLFHDKFPLKLKRINYAYYFPRMVHQSSLSAGTHALVAAQIGQRKTAYKFFLSSLHLDFYNLKGNTGDGIHTANLGNLWQILIFGFCGIVLEKDALSIQPSLPRDWEEVSFTFYWRQTQLKIKIQPHAVQITTVSRKKQLPGAIKVFGKIRRLMPNKTKIFRK